MAGHPGQKVDEWPTEAKGRLPGELHTCATMSPLVSPTFTG
jgi:hypothetical protein